jgi:LAO/AO transport system kinase
LEIADALLVTKSDGDNIKSSREAQAMYQQSFHILPEQPSGWMPIALTTSALTGEGIGEVWEMILNFSQSAKESGYFVQNRNHQTIAWFREYFKLLLESDLQKFKSVQLKRENLEHELVRLSIPPQEAARQLLDVYHQAIRDSAT